MGTTAEAEIQAGGRDRAVARVTFLWLATGGTLLVVLALAGLLLRITQGFGLLSPRWFYAFLTLHGTGMVGVALTTIAAAYWYVMSKALPLSPKVMFVVYLLTLVGALWIVAATLIGRFGTGWTFLYPLPSTPGPVPGWSGWAAAVFLVGLALVVVAFALWSLDFLRAGIVRFGGLGRMLGLDIVSGKRSAGPDTTDPSIIAGTVVAIGGVAAAVPGAVIVGLELANLAAPSFTFSALLAKNLIFFAGHMLVNVQIYLGAGLVYAILPEYAKRPWKASRVLVIAWLVTALFVMLAFFHHLYQDFAQPDALQVVGNVASFGVGFPPIVVTIFGGVLLVFRSGIRWTAAPIFLYAGLAGWAIGGFAAEIDASPGVNQYLHNTLWVPAHFHTYMALGVVLFILGAVYHIVPRLTGKGLSETLGRAAAWPIILGGWGLVAAWYASGVDSLPRRYAISLPGFQYMAKIGSVFAAIVAVGVLVVFWDFARILTGRGLGARAAPNR
ncbi:MAG TPA: cbb3-type cytochrome c oxidase subunit I [Actinomycetota bacterium]